MELYRVAIKDVTNNSRRMLDQTLNTSLWYICLLHYNRHLHAQHLLLIGTTRPCNIDCIQWLLVQQANQVYQFDVEYYYSLLNGTTLLTGMTRIYNTHDDQYPQDTTAIFLLAYWHHKGIILLTYWNQCIYCLLESQSFIMLMLQNPHCLLAPRVIFIVAKPTLKHAQALFLVKVS